MRVDPVTIAAVGDLSFQGLQHPASPAVFGDALPLFRRADAVVANLESPLTSNGVPLQGKCTLRGATDWARALDEAGVTLVSLANNHMMDFGPEGLSSTLRALDAAGVRYVGAGLTRAEAAAPVVLSIRGRRVAFLARTSVVVSAPMYAAGATPGVAFLDVHETCAAIERARTDAEFVVLLMHWGLEEYRYPSPDQRTLARRFARAGAQMVIGHHPHVTQGIERIELSVVAYSLGNFVFGEFEWEYVSPSGRTSRLFAGLSRQNREGLVLTLALSPDGSIGSHVTPTRTGLRGDVALDTSAERVAEMHSLATALTCWWYRSWWRLYAVRREWTLRFGGVLSPLQVVRKLHRIRPRHLTLLLHSARRSLNVVSQRSTNPYE